VRRSTSGRFCRAARLPLPSAPDPHH
jgi:hypothetical protein